MARSLSRRKTPEIFRQFVKTLHILARRQTTRQGCVERRGIGGILFWKLKSAMPRLVVDRRLLALRSLLPGQQHDHYQQQWRQQQWQQQQLQQQQQRLEQKFQNLWIKCCRACWGFRAPSTSEFPQRKRCPEFLGGAVSWKCSIWTAKKYRLESRIEC